MVAEIRRVRTEAQRLTRGRKSTADGRRWRTILDCTASTAAVNCGTRATGESPAKLVSMKRTIVVTGLAMVLGVIGMFGVSRAEAVSCGDTLGSGGTVVLTGDVGPCTTDLAWWWTDQSLSTLVGIPCAARQQVGTSVSCSPARGPW